MTRSSLALILISAIVIGICGPPPASAQDTSQIAGRWTLNRELSQFPHEIGFTPDWLSSVGSAQSPTTGGGRGRRGSGGEAAGGGPAGGFTSRRESEEDAKRQQQLTAEVRTPPTHLTILETPTAVTISDDQGQSRTFHPDGKEEVLQLDG